MNVINGRGGLPMLPIQTPWSTAEIYLQGACVTHFQLHGEAPLLFLSERSRFEANAPIRGGIPIIFPWFGKPSGRTTQHGFARTRPWELIDVAKQPDDTVLARLSLPPASELPGVALEYHVTVGRSLSVELVATNYSDANVALENCLHTYFTVGDIHKVKLTGLQGVHYLDCVGTRVTRTEVDPALNVSSEVDRIYFDSPQTVHIHDPELRRIIHIEKQHSHSTVVWNPWQAKAQLLTDFGDDEYLRMVCVESGNVASNHLTLAPGADSRLRAQFHSSAM